MDYQQIKSFLSVANHRNFTKAADELHVTQSTITTRIKNLENLVNRLHPLCKLATVKLYWIL
ncbi:hypothetical protein COE56_30945 [Bacillus anthracis]|nr:hypothetical protein COE56_30945 [Bacillus anthracis]